MVVISETRIEITSFENIFMLQTSQVVHCFALYGAFTYISPTLSFSFFSLFNASEIFHLISTEIFSPASVFFSIVENQFTVCFDNYSQAMAMKI